MSGTRFAIRIDRVWAPFLWLVGATRSSSYVAVGGDQVEVHLGLGFSARFRTADVRGAERRTRMATGVGVHGWAGRWLVNGSTRNLVSLTLGEGCRARVLGFPVRLRVLSVSAEDPDGLLAAFASAA
jgi:hypothetical protein